MIQNVVFLGRIAKAVTRWHEETRIRLNVGTKSDALMSIIIVGVAHSPPQSAFNDLLKARKRTTEDKKHIRCVDRIHITPLRITAWWRSVSGKSQTRADASRTMLI